MTKSIGQQAADIEAQIATTKAEAANVATELSALATQRLKGDPDASRRSTELRTAAAEAEQHLEDLASALEQMRKLDKIERQAQDLANQHERWRALLHLVELRQNAAADLDRLVLELAAAIRLTDELGQRAFRVADTLIGAAAISLLPAPAHEELTAGLVRFGAIDRSLLPPRWVGELGFIQPIATGAAHYSALAKRLAPKDLAL
jgi:TolA-binding protein